MILHICPNGHVSNTARFPDGNGNIKCFFCSKNTVKKEAEV